MVHASGGLVTPPSPHLKSEVAIICGMARATLPDSGIDWDALEADYDLIRDKIEAVLSAVVRGLQRPNPSAGRLPPVQRPARADLGYATGRANFLV